LERSSLPGSASRLAVCSLQTGIERNYSFEDKASILDTALDTPLGESPKVPRRIIEREPCAPEKPTLRIHYAGYERAYVGSANYQQSAGLGDSACFFEFSDRIGEVFNHVQNADRVKALRWKASGTQSTLRGIQFQNFSDVGGRFAEGLDSRDIEPALMRLADKRTPQTSDVKQFALASPQGCELVQEAGVLTVLPFRKDQFVCWGILFLARRFQERTARVMRDHFLFRERRGEENCAVAAPFESPLLDRRYEF
jgi:hypothetical protein